MPSENEETAFYLIQRVPVDQPLDSDIDGIDDVYELRHPLFLKPLTSFDAGQDFDGDGISNLDEFMAGTDPGALPLPFEFKITGFSFSEPDGAFIEHSSQGQSYYILCRGFTVTTMFPVVDVRLGTEPTGMLTDTNPPQESATLFYHALQVDQSSPLDSDGDGIDDVYELNRTHFLNPLNKADSMEDFDSDGRSSLQEYREDTDPAVPEVVLTTMDPSPFDGEVDVAVTRETILHFSNPISDTSVITSNEFFAEFAGQPLATRVAVSTDRKNDLVL